MGEVSPRLLVLTDKFAPHAGGTAVVWGEWCRCWPPETLRVVTRPFPGWQEFDRRQRYAVTRVSYLDLPKLRMPLLWLRLFVAGLREVCRRRPQVVHCAQIMETGCYAPWLKRRIGVPYVVHTYGEELSTFSRHPVLLRWMRRILAEADGVTTISGYTEGLLRSRIGYGGPVLRVHPGVDTSRYVPGDGGDIRQRLGLGDGPLLVTVGRLMRRKGHDRVLAALPRIRARHPEARYVIAGVGPEEERLRRLVRERRLEGCVQFLGRVSGAELPLLMQAADVFVHPNRALESGDVEGFGIVFLEASACGTPVIGGNSGGTPEAIQAGGTGFLIDPNRVEELEDRVLTLLGDASLRERMGRAGREWAAGFQWESAAARVWDLSRQAAGGGRC